MGKSFGTLVMELRKKNGLTQAALAEKMNVTDKAVSKWERDLSLPDTASIARLADILGTSADELLISSHKKDEGIKELLPLILKAVALAMGVAVVALSLFDRLDTKSANILLGLGLSSLSLFLLQKDKN